MHIHLDAVGGIAGDMFVAALVDTFPYLEQQARTAASGLAPAHCWVEPFNDGVLQGRRFLVERTGEAVGLRDPMTTGPNRPDQGHAHAHAHALDDDHGPARDHGHRHGAHDAGHGHRAWAAIKADLDAAALPERARTHAIGIFACLAQAEARVHGIAAEDVTFHEVGAWDSVADIVTAGALVATLEAEYGAVTWSVGPLPLGSGRVRTAHGLLPVPAPATALLLHGFAMVDDGIAGERVTPTGAAILQHLCPPPHAAGSTTPRTMAKAGIGFGTRRLPGISNCLRALAFDDRPAAQAAHTVPHRDLAVLEFEVDDQTAEDLAMGLDRLRAHPDVFDVVQSPVFGKKGRVMAHVRVLARVTACEEVAAACFRETTTIGLRHHRVSGSALARDARTVEIDGRPVRVKLVQRPGGATAKAEADDALAQEGHAMRAALRRKAERLALDDDGAR